jgi:hypothetical protein
MQTLMDDAGIFIEVSGTMQIFIGASTQRVAQASAKHHSRITP